MTELEVGMVIYAETRFGDKLTKGEITRTTKTQAIARLSTGCEYRFNKMQERKHFYEKGNLSGLRDIYRIATPELDERYYKQQLVDRYKKIEPEKLSVTELKEIIVIAAGK